VRALVVGVGNRNRGDDGVGPRVVDAVRARLAHVSTYLAHGDLSDLVMRWEPDQRVIVVDAMVSGRPPGSIVQVNAIEEQLPIDGGLLSSHGVGLAEAVELARVLDRLPATLTIFGVEAEQFEHLGKVGTNVASAIDEVVDRIEALI
jgi:hydrogenase maturation protease